MLKWDQADLVSFFGVVPTYNDDACSHSFELDRDGLKLLLTIFDLEGAVFVGIFRDGLPAPIIMIQRELCTHAHINSGRDLRRCFEAGTPEQPVTNMGIPPVLVRGFRVYVEPHFQIELIESRFGSI